MQDGYDAGAKLFHWSVAVLVLVTIPIGLTMNVIGEGRLQDLLYMLHESIGLTILALMLGRLAWRLTHGAPLPSRSLNRIEVLGSQAVHVLLYFIILVMPISGYILVVAGDFPLTWFDLANVPRLLAKNEALSKRAENAHLTLQWAIYGLLLAHIAAALHHHFLRHNDVLRRMWPGRARNIGQE